MTTIIVGAVCFVAGLVGGDRLRAYLVAKAKAAEAQAVTAIEGAIKKN